MELQIFQSFHDSKLSAQEKTEIILKSGSWTSFHLNAEVFEYKFSHIKFFVNKNILKIEREKGYVSGWENTKFGVISRDALYKVQKVYKYLSDLSVYFVMPVHF